MTVLSAIGALAGCVSKDVVHNSMLPAVVACSKVRVAGWRQVEMWRLVKLIGVRLLSAGWPELQAALQQVSGSVF